MLISTLSFVHVPQVGTYDGKRRGTIDCEVLQAYLSDSLFRGEDFPSYALDAC
jgi:hypothetical protein